MDITIEGDHNQGMVVDFNDLKQSTREVLARYDHRHWNDVLEFPSVENICELLSRELRAAHRVSDGGPRVGRQRQVGGDVTDPGKPVHDRW